MKKIAILGSTGSIGTQALDIVRNSTGRYKVSVLSCNNNIDLLKRQIAEFKPEAVVIGKEEYINEIKNKFPKVEILVGKNGLKEVVRIDFDLLLNSLVGISGLEPTYQAIKEGKDIALANKETLVAGGELIMSLAKLHNVKILPVDSEHSAIFQCLQGNKKEFLRKIYLTASGGPFRGFNLKQLDKVNIEQALNHPKWKMGNKITIDSATLMNKGLEVIEAKWLFDISEKNIEILVHPQSIVHSMVEYVDNSIIAQLGSPDMRIPISYAMNDTKRYESYFESINFIEKCSELKFEKPDFNTFKTLELAYESLKRGGSYAVALNAGNEILVDKFLKGDIKFLDIQNNLIKLMDMYSPKFNLTVEEILEEDKNVRRLVLDNLSI